jgi:uncharacterized protein (TIGR02646 family)
MLNSTVYRRARETLWDLQHGKCCYCECAIDRSYNDVEHFRPFVRYWWLAYSWENLLLACKYCNETAKKDAFELEADSVPLLAKHQPPGGERPLFIDPASEDPADFIVFSHDDRFQCWQPRPRDNNPRAAYTLKTLHLQEARNRERRAAIEQDAEGRVRLWQLARLRGAGASELAEHRRQAEAMTRDDKPFAALARAILAEILEDPEP